LDASERFLVTLNNHGAVDPKRVLKRLVYEHPIYTEESVSAQARRREISGVGRTFYCGAYWGNGFHEDGVVSALQALDEFAEVQREQFALPRAS
jgi:predicted NAD/FAD-binding protein